MKRYVEFELVAKKPKTDVYSVLSLSSGDLLGEVKGMGLGGSIVSFLRGKLFGLKAV